MPDSTTYVRKDAWQLPPGDETLHWYAVGVGAMMERAPDDPTSWSYQANMHGTTDPRTLPLWKGCQHGSWFFVAWHRMYVLFFEEIVRAAIVAAGGPADWALPFWNYTSASPHDEIPLPFRDPKSPLYRAERCTVPYVINDGAPLDPDVTSYTNALDTVPFVPTSLPITGFAGEVENAPIHYNRGFGALEQQPHNTVHDAIGGPTGLMSDPNTAAQDPIFWLHHSNIDRLWASWIAIGEGRADTDDSRWTDQPFSFFTPDGTEQFMTAEMVESTEALGYTYSYLEPLPAAPEEAGVPDVVSATPPPHDLRAELVGGTSEPVVLTGGHAEKVVPIDAPTRDSLLAAARADEPRQVLLALDDITAERNPGRPYAVYVNLPEGLSREEAREHLAGTVGFFGIESAAEPDTDEHPHPFHAAFDITKLVRRLSARGQWDPDSVHVTFRPAGVLPPQGAAEVADEALPEHPPVSVGRISVHYA